MFLMNVFCSLTHRRRQTPYRQVIGNIFQCSFLHRWKDMGPNHRSPVLPEVRFLEGIRGAIWRHSNVTSWTWGLEVGTHTSVGVSDPSLLDLVGAEAEPHSGHSWCPHQGHAQHRTLICAGVDPWRTDALRVLGVHWVAARAGCSSPVGT